MAESATLASLRAQAEKIVVVAAGVDTLELHTAQPLRQAFVAQLEGLKLQAQALRKGDPLPTWTCAGRVFDVKRSGSKRGSLLLECEAMAVSLNPWAPEGLPTGMIEVRSRPLWQGVDEAAQDAEEVLSVLTMGESPEVQVSRVDVTVDWQGWMPERDLLDNFVCRARSDASYRQNKRHTGWSWGGGGAVLARQYDKTAEIRGGEKEDWLPDVWAQAPGYVDGEDVARLEFQVRREAIRELTPLGVDPGALKTWDGTREHLGSIFSSLSEHWLSLRLPRTAKTRQVLDPRWAKLRELAVFKGCPAPVDLSRVQAETEFARTLDQLSGYLARGIAERWALRGREDDTAATYEKLYYDVCKHLADKGQSLETKARDLFEPLRVKAAAQAARKRQRADRLSEQQQLSIH